MGTNYYAKEDVCPCCGHAKETIHLGKSSYGWKFTFQYNGGVYYKNIEEMKLWINDKKIIDEYGTEISHTEFWDMIKEKQEDKKNLSHYQHCKENGYAMYRELFIDGYSFTDCEFS